MANSGRRGELRIIGGSWRGRKLRFTALDGLRPTSDRVRETLFNWLTPEIHGARCLDLFAGSGALGLEALSRGAAHCDFVDRAKTATADINAHLRTLDAADRGLCHQATAEIFLQRANSIYDIVFVDPPFGAGLAQPAIDLLGQRALLAPQALVYFESGAGDTQPDVPSQWKLHRDKTAGAVAYRLYRFEC